MGRTHLFSNTASSGSCSSASFPARVSRAFLLPSCDHGKGESWEICFWDRAPSVECVSGIDQRKWVVAKALRSSPGVPKDRFLNYELRAGIDPAWPAPSSPVPAADGIRGRLPIWVRDGFDHRIKAQNVRVRSQAHSPSHSSTHSC